MRKRKQQIHIFLDEKEYARLLDITAKAKISISVFVRKSINTTTIKAPPNRDYKGLYSEINAIGRNVNQIARKCNEGEDVQQFREEMLFYLSTLYQLLDKHL